MKHVELIRSRILRGFSGEFARLRVYISGTDGNQESVDQLRGEPGELLLAKVTDMVMRELGHEVETPVEEKNSVVRRALKRVRRASGDE